jgi:hypothetical protein
MRLLFRAAVVTAFTLPFLASAALVAYADEGSRGGQVAASPQIRPPLGVLRHVDAPTASPAPAGASLPELVVLVGGYQSCACPDDGTFDALRKGLAAVPNTDVVRFGTDPRFPYDTFGPIDASAINLRDYIRSVAPNYSVVHIVTHSMGGNVADRAFANGLSREDGVATYVAWSAPHSGSDAARGLTLASRVAGGPNPAIRESLLWLQMESESQAVRDLAGTRPVAPPKGVVRLDLREANDALVTPRDARDPGVASRTLDSLDEGHSGILTDPEAIDLTLRTIATRAVPPERRSRIVVGAIEGKSNIVGLCVFAAVCVLTTAAYVYASKTTPVFRVPIVRALRDLLPRAARKPCP